MSAVEQPMSIYHPDAATPRRVETVRARSIGATRIVSEDGYAAAMRKLDGVASCRFPPSPRTEASSPGPTPRATSLAHMTRAALAQGAATVDVLTDRMGVPRQNVNDGLQSQRRQGMAQQCALTGVWVLTDKGRAAFEKAGSL